MTSPVQMGTEPRDAETGAGQQQAAETPRRARPKADGDTPAAPPQMGAPLFRDWADI